MAMEVGAKTGAGYGEKNGFRLAQRNDHRDRDWETRAGTVELSIPRLRTGSYFPSFREPRRMAEKVMTAVIPAQTRSVCREEAYIQAVSTRSVYDLVKAMVMSSIAECQVSRLCGEINDKDLSAIWQRCRVHFMRNAPVYAGKSGRRAAPPSSPRPLRKTRRRPQAPSGATLPTKSGRKFCCWLLSSLCRNQHTSKQPPH
ncbi:mutator family transposase [Rhizobium sp. PP-WC-2G-219]|nr:mutator family transposase [Rhizobium sp. PP-WC-2G-219]